MSQTLYTHCRPAIYIIFNSLAFGQEDGPGWSVQTISELRSMRHSSSQWSNLDVIPFLAGVNWRVPQLNVRMWVLFN